MINVDKQKGFIIWVPHLNLGVHRVANGINGAKA